MHPTPLGEEDGGEKAITSNAKHVTLLHQRYCYDSLTIITAACTFPSGKNITDLFSLSLLLFCCCHLFVFVFSPQLPDCTEEGEKTRSIIYSAATFLHVFGVVFT